MGCCGDREKQEFLRTQQKWDYVNLDDFKATSCLTPLAYVYLLIMFAVSISVYAGDTFTAVNLVAFDKWSGQIQPAIPFTIARWIYAGCIILSFVLLIYRWWRAIRVMRQGGVAKSYLDPLAVRVQCIRMGKHGRGWKRFLVFAELTKSRKGADYVALFAYFSFEAWLRIVFAEGPRQVVNGITLYSVMQASLIPSGQHAATGGHSPFIQFWLNVGILANESKLQAAILLSMVWTLVIWVISALSLALSVILYLIFLWHHIPAQDGSLTQYCRKKINRRMERIVKVKVDKALKKENEIRVRQEAQAARDGSSIKKQPTLPNIGMDDTLPPLSRQTTMTTLPEYESRPASIRTSADSMPPMPLQDQRPLPRRHMTQASDSSWASYKSNAPLVGGAGDMGYADRVQTPGSAVSTPWSARPMPTRSATGFSQYSDQPFTPGPRPPTSQSMRSAPGTYQMEPLPRPGTASSNSRFRRQPSDSDHSTYRGQTPVSSAPYPIGGNGSYFPPIPESDLSGRSSPAMPLRSQTPQGPPPRSHTPQGPPPRSFTASVPPPDRSYTPSLPYPDRSFTPAGNPPPLPRIQTSDTVASAGNYVAFNPRAQTPVSAPASQEQQTQGYRSFSRPTFQGHGSYDANRDSGFEDIINHYRS